MRRNLRRLWRGRVRDVWRRVEWPLVLAGGVIAFILGFRGFADYFAVRNIARTPLDIIYYTFQLFTLESGAVEDPVGWRLELARILAPTVAAYAAIQALVALFSKQIQAVRLRFMRNHRVICGLGRMGYRLALRFLDDGERVVAIERNESSPLVEFCREQGAIVLTGDATYRALLQAAGAARAHSVIAVCGDDTVNTEIAVHARALVAPPDDPGASRRTPRPARPYPLTCTAHVTDMQLWERLGGKDITLETDHQFRLQFFSVFESGARMLVRQDPTLGEHAGTAPARPPHYLVIGVGSLGGNLIAHLARRWWALRGERHGATRTLPRDARLRVTIIDHDAAEALADLAARYGRLDAACELTAEALDVRSAAFRRGDFLRPGGPGGDFAAIYVCFDDDALGLTCALALTDRLGDRRSPVIVRMSHSGGLAALLGRAPGDEGATITAFPLLRRTCTPEIASAGIRENIARAIHADFVRDGTLRGQTVATNPSLVGWDALPADLRESSRDQADHIGAKLRAVRCRLVRLRDWDADLFEFTADEVEHLAVMEHDRWCRERLRGGWRLGPKDTARRTHPHLCPLDDIADAETREQVLAFNRAAIRALPRVLAGVDLEIQRV